MDITLQTHIFEGSADQAVERDIEAGTGRTIYILDEPTAGLHFADIEKFLKVPNRLVDNKNSVPVIEHRLDKTETAAQLIEMKPKGGQSGVGDASI